MQTFYVLIKKNFLSIYEKNGNAYEKVYLGGNPDFSYSVSSAKECADRFLKMILDEYNLNTMGEIDFVVIDNEDEILSDVMLRAFGQSVKKRISIEGLIGEVLSNIGRDKKLQISEYGINFDGKKYLVKGKQVVKEEFSLLAYTLSDDMLIKFVRLGDTI